MAYQTQPQQGMDKNFNMGKYLRQMTALGEGAVDSLTQPMSWMVDRGLANLPGGQPTFLPGEMRQPQAPIEQARQGNQDMWSNITQNMAGAVDPRAGQYIQDAVRQHPTMNTIGELANPMTLHPSMKLPNIGQGIDNAFGWLSNRPEREPTSMLARISNNKERL